MKKVGIVLLCILLIGALAVPAMAGQGCSQGFWKNHPEAWGPTGRSETDLVEVVFAGAIPYVDSEDTLLQALRYRGGRGLEGGARILLRQAVAALLNEAHTGVSYTQDVADVITSVNEALASDDRDEMLSLAGMLDIYNNLGCPLDELDEQDTD